MTPTEMDIYYQHLAVESVTPFEGIIDTHSKLRDKGLSIAVFTGASSRGANVALETAGICVDILIGGDNVTHQKPHAEGVLLGAKLLGVEPSDLIYVGDSINDVKAANNAGAVSAAAGWGHLFSPSHPAHVVLDKPSDVLQYI